MKSKEKEQIMKEYGWSETIENQFFTFANQIIGDKFKGRFTIKKNNQTNTWFWYYRFSSTTIQPRTKYLCSCDEPTSSNKSSFDNATQKLLEKINHNFSNKDVIEPLLSKYITEYIKLSMEWGGLEYRKRGSYTALVPIENITPKKNSSTMKRRVKVLTEFKEFCDKKKLKTIQSSKGEEFREIMKEYFLLLKERNKKTRDGLILGDKHLTRATIKLHFQSIRMFLNWLSTPKSENGRGLIKQHTITPSFQNHLLTDPTIGFGDFRKPQRIYEDFSKKNYEKVLCDCQEYIAQVWRLYCKYGGDREKIREERLSYNEKLKDGTLSGRKHKNQPKEMIVMSDVVFFVSFIQIAYGTRITEILQSFRNYDMWNEFAENKETQVSSYFSRVEGEDGEMDYYHLKIENSKKKSRTIPITDVIYSWEEPPKGVPFRKKEREEENRFDIYETNIIDVIFELFYPREHSKTFPSPNLNEKPNKGYSNNWYMNLFKERCVNSEDCNWKEYGIASSHHLRSYFVSYMFLQDVRVEDVIEITGHSYQTAMGYYRRINTQMMRDTLSHRDLRTILNKNKINQKEKR